MTSVITYVHHLPVQWGFPQTSSRCSWRLHFPSRECPTHLLVLHLLLVSIASLWLKWSPVQSIIIIIINWFPCPIPSPETEKSTSQAEEYRPPAAQPLPAETWSFCRTQNCGWHSLPCLLEECSSSQRLHNVHAWSTGSSGIIRFSKGQIHIHTQKICSRHEPISCIPPSRYLEFADRHLLAKCMPTKSHNQVRNVIVGQRLLH